MPEQKRQRRISIVCDGEFRNALERQARKEHRTLSSLAELYIHQGLEGDDALSQVSKYIQLLTGERSRRNGISFAELEGVLGISQESLKALYDLVRDCRARELINGNHTTT